MCQKNLISPQNYDPYLKIQTEKSQHQLLVSTVFPTANFLRKEKKGHKRLISVKQSIFKK